MIWRRIVRKRAEVEGRGRDMAVMARVDRLAAERPWLARTALAATLFALVATSAPPSYYYVFAAELAGPPTELTAGAPARRFRLRVRATALAPNGQPTTSAVHARLSGIISAAAMPTSPTFVSASWSSGASAQPSDTVSAVTEFTLSRELPFSGDCNDPASGSCEAEAVIDLERTDRGAAGGRLAVDWSLSLHASVQKDGEPDDHRTPPWELEVVEE